MNAEQTDIAAPIGAPSATPKIGIVTGAASGIGQATALLLAERGWRLGLMDRDEAGLKATAGMIGEGCATYVADVSQAADCQRVVDGTVDRHGRIDGLAHCAAITLATDVRIEDVSDDDFDRILAVNLRGTFLMCKRVLPHIVKSVGAIVNLGSVATLHGGLSTAYPASKGGVAALTRSIAFQTAEHGVRANAVLPGLVDTPMLAVSRSKLGSSLAPRPGVYSRMASPREIAYMIAFLLSDEARFVTGSSYVVDGGATQH